MLLCESLSMLPIMMYNMMDVQCLQLYEIVNKY